MQNILTTVRASTYALRNEFQNFLGVNEKSDYLYAHVEKSKDIDFQHVGTIILLSPQDPVIVQWFTPPLPVPPLDWHCNSPLICNWILQFKTRLK